MVELIKFLDNILKSKVKKNKAIPVTGRGGL
jgi:hypothetical protein